MKTKLTIITTTLALLALTGCESTPRNVNNQRDRGHAVMALDYRDFATAADEMVQDLIKSRRLLNPNGPPFVMAASVITNDTMQRIDTDQLMVKVQQDLTNSGQVRMTATTGFGSNIDPLIRQARQDRNDPETNQSTIAGQGTLISPDLSISGKIFQRDVRYDSRTTQVEYYFQLQVANMRTGIIEWIKEVNLNKRGSNRSVSW